MRFVILLLLISLSGYSQNIRTEIDKFTKEKIIKTTYSAICPAIIAPLSIKITSIGKETIYITLYGDDKNVIGADDTATFLLDDKTTITIHSIDDQGYDRNRDGKYFIHHYSIAVNDFKTLSEHIIIRIRKSEGTTYHDFVIKKKYAEKFKNFQLKFLEEFNKQ